MTKGDLYSVVVKIIGLYFFIKSIQLIIYLLIMVIKHQEFSDSSDILLIYSSASAMMLLYFILVYFGTIKATTMTNRILNSESKTIDLNLGNRVDRWILLKAAGSYLEYNGILGISVVKFHWLIDPSRDE